MKQLPYAEKITTRSPGKRPAAEPVHVNTFTGSALYPPVQRKPNNTGLPDQLKDNVEQTSGYSMDDVNVHYNSSKPARLNAHAYAQGTDIHVGPGQEKHLPHEAWHVVQQKQGRVKPTLTISDVPVNDDVMLENEADQMGSVVAQRVKSDYKPTKLKPSINAKGARISQRILQRKVKLNTTLTINNLKGIEVSKGGSLGVVHIPSVVAKYEADPQAAVDTAESINTLLGGEAVDKWSVAAPAARRASPDEAAAIHHTLYAKDMHEPGSVGEPDRVDKMVKKIQANPDNIVIFEESSGKDFIKHLAKGPGENDAKKEQTNKSSSKLKKGRGLDLLATPAYARQLGRVAAIDIFMGNNDRLHSKGNFENWMSDAKSKKITLIDNEATTHAVEDWSKHPDVGDMANSNFDNLAFSLTEIVEQTLFWGKMGGGKLNAQEQGFWTNNIRPQFTNNMATGLSEGKFYIMSKGWSLAVKLKASHSPLGNTFEDRLNYFDANM